MIHTLSQNGYRNWVCPRCKGALQGGNDNYSCKPCGLAFRSRYGLPDFRLNTQYDTEDSLLLAEQYVSQWSELTYQDMVRMRFQRLREGALAAGKRPADFKMWDLDEQAHLASYRTRGKRHLAIVMNALKRCGQAEHVGCLIDVGCGWGRDLLHLAGIGDHVIGVDVSTYSLLMTRKLLEEQGIANVTLVLAEGQFLPLHSKSVDAINSSATIEHFPTPGDFLRECSRCLCEPGWMFLYYPNRFSLLTESHTGIWGLGLWPREHQARVVRRKTGGEWNVTLFSRRSFTRLLQSTCTYRELSITGIPRGIEDFLVTSKFASLYPSLARLLRCAIPGARAMPGFERLTSFFSPVHFVMVGR